MNKIAKEGIKIGAEFLVGVVVDCVAQGFKDFKDDKILKGKTPAEMKEHLTKIINKTHSDLKKAAFEKIKALNLKDDESVKVMALKYLDTKLKRWNDKISYIIIAFEALKEAGVDEAEFKRNFSQEIENFINNLKEDIREIENWIEIRLTWEGIKYEAENDILETFAHEGKVYYVPRKEAYRVGLFQFYKRAIDTLEEKGDEEAINDALAKMRMNINDINLAYPRIYQRAIKHHNGDIEKCFIENMEFAEALYKNFEKSQEKEAK